MYSIKIYAPFYEYEATAVFEEATYDIVEEYIRDFLWSDIFDGLIAKYKLEPSGYFPDIHAIGADLYEYMEETIKCAERIVAVCEESDSEAVQPVISEYCLKELFIEMVKESSMDESFHVNTGKIVEDSLYQFVKSSTWHFGLLCETDSSVLEEISQWPTPIERDGQICFEQGGKKYLPILWYGPIGKSPIPRWMITPNDDTEKLSFWFDINEVMDNLQDDPDQMFLVWYIYECGRYYPEVDDIIANCPVAICEGDTNEEICKKIYAFFSKYSPNI